MLERTIILHHDVDVIRKEHLPEEIRGGGAPVDAGCPFSLPPGGVDLDEVEAGLIRQALERTSHNKSKAAELLGISRYALRYRMEKHKVA